MTRALPLFLLTLVGCARGDIQDRAVQFPTTRAVEGGGFAAVLGGVVLATPDARDAIERWEVEVDVGFAYSEDNPPQGELSVTVGLLQEIGSDFFEDGGADWRWDDPDFTGCTEDGMEELEDGSCQLSLLILIGLDRATQGSASLAGRGWLSDDSGIDPETLVIDARLEEAQPEE